MFVDLTGEEASCVFRENSFMWTCRVGHGAVSRVWGVYGVVGGCVVWTQVSGAFRGLAEWGDACMRYALGGSYLGCRWGGAARSCGEGPLTLRSCKALLAVSTDIVRSTSVSRGQWALSAGTVTRVGS